MNGFTKEGKWLTFPDLPTHGKDCASDVNEANGYRLMEHLGERDGFGLEVWDKWDDGEASYLVSLETTGSWREIFCPDTPALLEFMRLHGYAWLECGARDAQREWLEEMTDLLTHRRYGIFRDEFAEARAGKDEYYRPRPKASA